VTNYALRVAHYDPASAAQWAESLPSDKIRDVVFQNIYVEWKARDAAAADAFAAKHGLAR
jgi:hypothetical protein